MKRILMGLGIGGLLLAGWAQAQTYGGSSGSSGSSQSGSSMGGSSATPSSPSGTSQGSSAGAAGSTAGGSASTMGTMGSTKEISGKVQNFDRSNNTLTVAGSDKSLKVDSATEVSKDGAKASLSDIKEGDQVRASYSGTGADLHVQKLDIMSKGSSGSMGAPSGAPSTTPPPPSGSQTPSGSKGY